MLVRLGTLNVGTLTDKSPELADNLRKRRVDTCRVQKTRWKDSKSGELGDGYKLTYHGTSNRNGASEYSAILNETLGNSVTAVDRQSNRLMAVKVDTREMELRVFSVYAPQVGCSEEEKAFGKTWSSTSNPIWWKTRQPEDRGAYLAEKKEAKKAVSKAKSDRYKAVYGMFDTREGEWAMYRLITARYRSTLDMEHTKIVKRADDAILSRQTQLYFVNRIVAEGRTSDVWQSSMTVPIWKGKGDIAECTSYKPI
ncbi:hypothetical protein RB195_010827 [Necator americanus]|uniref:Uncharacterized protein n=1 Tax=Necator americanus TaxID=51031 RepID=A0ABR1CZY6_NECAM